jgi:hypothetical protein
MKIKYILIIIIFFTKTTILLAAEKKYTLLDVFKPHPETTLSMLANSMVLILQDYQTNPDAFPSEALVPAITWGNLAAYSGGLLVRIRKYYKQRKKKLIEDTSKQNTLKETLIRKNDGNSDEEHSEYNPQKTGKFNLIRSGISNNSGEIEISFRNSDDNDKNSSILIDVLNSQKSKLEKEYIIEQESKYKKEKIEEMKSTQSRESKIDYDIKKNEVSLPDQESSSNGTIAITSTNSFITIMTNKTNH